MFEESTVSTFEAPANLCEVTREVAPEAPLKATEPSLEVRAKSAKELAEEYEVSDRTIQTWFKTVTAAHPWIELETLKTGKSAKTRYTPLCQTLIAEYRAVASNVSEENWIASVHAANPEKLSAPPTTQRQNDVPLSPTEVLPREDEQPSNGDPCGNGNAARPGGMLLHIGSSLALPKIPGVVTPGNDTAYLTQAQQRMQQFEALQQQVLAQIQQQQKEAETLNAQYQEATSLSDQLLLQEFQLKGVQLGYTALQLKQQAFKATVQAAEAGTLPAPGKLQSENGQSQSS
ncbi:MAG: hypothetical protein NW224_30700 [Leptolyngbyaceae cyanobacterium bins.302]|nr:hypothetical protein [Leptolyngbyaceae cyanobacterium bins.302]